MSVITSVLSERDPQLGGGLERKISRGCDASRLVVTAAVRGGGWVGRGGIGGRHALPPERPTAGRHKSPSQGCRDGNSPGGFIPLAGLTLRTVAVVPALLECGY